MIVSISRGISHRSLKTQLSAKTHSLNSRALTRYDFSTKDPSPQLSPSPQDDTMTSLSLQKRPRAQSAYNKLAHKKVHYKKRNGHNKEKNEAYHIPSQVIGITNILKEQSLSTQIPSEDGLKENDSNYKSDSLVQPDEDKTKSGVDLGSLNSTPHVSTRTNNLKTEQKRRKQKKNEKSYQIKERRQIQKNKTGSNPSDAISAIKDVTTSEWLLVSNIPPMSKLSDLLPSLSNILEYEINKGIIDINKLTSENDSETHHDYTRHLEENDALPLLYSAKSLTNDSGIPLLNINLNPDLSLPSQFITEARLHLSYRARPMGWFLRFTDESIAHAIFCHIQEAGKHEELIRGQFEKERDEVLKERRVWTEKLWKSVHDDYGINTRKYESVFNDRMEEKELMWGKDFDHDPIEVDSTGEVDNPDSCKYDQLGGIDEAINSSEGECNNDVNDFFDEYTKSHPYPMHSTSMPSVETVFGLHYLKCGSTPLLVDKFSPTSTPVETNERLGIWEQHSFHLGNLLDLSDSCVRVETHALKTSVAEIKWLFRGYDFKNIYPLSSDSKDQLPSLSFADLPKSIGWNLNRYVVNDKETNSPDAVDFLVIGKGRAFRDQNEKFSRTTKQIDRPTHHVFLIRFATPADARMAVRQMQGTMFNERRMLLSQYPSADTIEERNAVH